VCPSSAPSAVCYTRHGVLASAMVAFARRAGALNRVERSMTERTEEVAQTSAQPQRLDPDRETTGPVAFNSPLPASALNIEAKSRSNLFPWRGQFSPQLVEALLRAYAAPGSVVLDPFMGSGTVLVESARLGLSAHGYEINPAAYLVARVYEMCSLTAAARRELLEKAEAILTQARPAAFGLPLFRVGPTEAPLPGNSSDWVRATPDPRVRMLLEALVVLLDEDSPSDYSYASKWSVIREVVSRLPLSGTAVHPALGDARALRLADGTIGFVLSSPPYINVFNYHHNSRTGIESLGWKPLVVARSEIGSNRKFRQNRFLTVVQYCIDMALALAELGRVCTENARILLVLGRESNVHKTAFYNGQIVERLAAEVVGLRLHLKQERVFLNRFGQSIYEDLLHLSPQPDHCRSKEAIVECARRLGRDVLSESAERTPSDRRHYLLDAIAAADQVEASPILEPAAVVEGAI
jgi:DNA methylase